jgi:hypothetical protein
LEIADIAAQKSFVPNRIAQKTLKVGMTKQNFYLGSILVGIKVG